MAVLECAGVHHVVNPGEYLVPLPLVVLHAHSVLDFQACAHDCLFPVNPW